MKSRDNELQYGGKPTAEQLRKRKKAVTLEEGPRSPQVYFCSTSSIKNCMYYNFWWLPKPHILRPCIHNPSKVKTTIPFLVVIAPFLVSTTPYLVVTYHFLLISSPFLITTLKTTFLKVTTSLLLLICML